MKRLVAASLALTVWSAVMYLFLHLGSLAPYNYPPRFNMPVDSPILAIELAQTPSDLRAVLHPDNTTAAARAISINTDLDLIFIPLYVFFLLTLARGLRSIRPAATSIVALLAVLAGLADYSEDALIWQAMNGRTGVHWASLTKLTLLALCIATLAGLLLRSRGVLFSLATDRLLGVGYLLSAVMMLGGIVLGREHYDLLQSGFGLFCSLIPVLWISPLLNWLSMRFPGQPPQRTDNFCETRPPSRRRGVAGLF